MKQTATFDYKFPVDPGFGPQGSSVHHGQTDLDSLKYDASSYEELFGDLHEVTPQPHDPSPGSKMQSIEDFQDLDVDLLGLVQGNHPNNAGGVAYSNPTPATNASVNSSNTNIMYPSTLPSPQLGTPMSQMSLTSQSISSSESLHHTPPMAMSVLSSHQQSPFQHQQLQQQVTQQLQHQQLPPQQHQQQVPHPQQPQQPPQNPQGQLPPQTQMAPQPAAAQARRQPWNMNMNMVSAPTPWGAWGLGGSAAAAAAAAALSQHNGVRVSHIPVNNNPAPRKKLSEHQLRVLEKVFNETPKPCLKTRTELERDLDLPKKNIQIWFQNRRAKEKQNIKKREGELANAAANSSANANSASGSSAVRQPHMAAAAAAAAINSDGPQPENSANINPPMKPVMHIPNANGKQVPTTTRQRPGLSLQRTFSTSSQSSINNQNNNNTNSMTPTTPIMGAPPKNPNPTTPVGLGGSTKHPSSTSLPALASTTNSDTPKRHRSNSSASFDRRSSTSAANSNQSTLVGMGISMPGHGHSRASSTSVLGPPLERKTPAETLAAASKMRRSNSFMGNNMSLSRRGSETASAPSHARKNSMPMNHVTGQVGSVTSLTSIMTPSLSHTPSASGQVTPNLMTPHTPQFSLDDGEVTPLNSPSAFTGHMMTPGPGPATPMSSQFRDRSFSQSSLYGPIAEDHTLETNNGNMGNGSGNNINNQNNNNNNNNGSHQPMQYGNPVEFDVGGSNSSHSNNMNYGVNGVAGASRDSSVYTTNSNGFSQSQGSGSFTSLSTSVDSMSAVSMVMPDSTPMFTPAMDDATIAGGDADGKRVSVVKEEDDPYFQFVLSSMFPQDQAQDNDEFYNTMMGIS